MLRNARGYRRLALALLGLLTVAGFLTHSLVSRAGSYTTLANAVSMTYGTVSGGTASDTRTSNNTRLSLYEDSSYRLGATFTMDTVTVPTPAKIYKVVLTMEGLVNSVDDYWYPKLYDGASYVNTGLTPVNFGQLTTSDTTITVSAADPAQVQKYYNNGSPRVRIQDTKVATGAASDPNNLRTYLRIDYLALTFYDDTTAPSLTNHNPPNGTTIGGTTTVGVDAVVSS
ncbi:MAG: hypothetical protein M1553_07425 [Firmicutes bacterium]|nr:hypothetical protein [Bacillota bacterium]